MFRMPSRSIRRLVVIAALVALAAGACGGDPSGDIGGPAADRSTAGSPTDMQAAPAPDGGLTVSEALDSDLEGPLTVTGFLVEADGEVRLCETILESYPPQCGQPSLTVEGVDPSAFQGAQTQEGVTWVEGVSLTGKIVDGTLRISPTST